MEYSDGQIARAFGAVYRSLWRCVFLLLLPAVGQGEDEVSGWLDSSHGVVNASVSLIRRPGTEEHVGFAHGDPSNRGSVVARGGTHMSSINLLDWAPIGTRWSTKVLGSSPIAKRLNELMAREGGAVGFPGWSPDGEWLAFVLSKGGVHSLWLLNNSTLQSHRVSASPVNLFVGCQGRQTLTSQRKSPPFCWSRDSQKLTFASPLFRDRSVLERIHLHLIPSVMDSAEPGEAYAIYEPTIRSLDRDVFESQIYEVEVTAGLDLRKIGTPIQVGQLLYVGRDRLVVGTRVPRGARVRHTYYLAERRDGPSDESYWSSATELFSTSGTVVLIEETEAQIEDFIAVVLRGTEGCTENERAKRVTVVCLADQVRAAYPVSGYDQLVTYEASGKIALLDKRTGESRLSIDPPASAEPGVRATHRLLMTSDGIHVRPNLDLVLVQEFWDEGRLTGYQFQLLNAQDGSKKLLFSDPTNNSSLVRVWAIEEGGDVLVERAVGPAQSNFALLNLKDGGLRDVSPAFMSRYSFADFDSEDLTYEREDGFPLSGRIFWPKNDERVAPKELPLVIWQYPLQIEDTSAGVARLERWRTSRYRSLVDVEYLGNWLPLFLLDQGIAVFHYPAFPLVGEDDASAVGTFNQQMIQNARAAVDAAVATGRIDSTRIAIAGHSRGGGDAALLLAYTDLFRTGFSIAGGMNPMLMPHASQYERRSMREVPEVYLRNSASAQAHLIDEPLLMIHGTNDGSYAQPGVSLSLYYAMAAAQRKSRFVELPFMLHEPRTTRERGVLVQEVLVWLEKHL